MLAKCVKRTTWRCAHRRKDLAAPLAPCLLRVPPSSKAVLGSQVTGSPFIRASNFRTHRQLRALHVNMSPVYRSLNSEAHEIRLLKLLPDESDFQSPIRCELLYRFLDDIEEYEALTYFWGDINEDPQTVDIDGGHSIAITKNLEIALRHLRRPKDPRILWVDALCINQGDVSERNHQVSLMKDIYSRCSRDIAWLGPRQGEKEDQTDLIKEGVELMQRISLKDLTNVDDIYRGDVGDHTSRDGWVVSYKHRIALAALFDTPMVWQRVWVMQELACATNITLTYGHETLDWSVVAAFLGDQPYADAFHLAGGHGSVYSLINSVMTGPQTIMHQRGIMRDGYHASLLDVLARFKNVYSTDPRDKIYGLLGLVTEKHGIRVDYAKPPRDLFAEVTLHFINSLTNLDIICQNPWSVDKEEARADLSSWVANFADEINIGVDAETHYSRLLFAQRSIFSAGRPNCAVPVPAQTNNEGRHQIRLKGTIVGKLGPALHDQCHDNDRWDWLYFQPGAWMRVYFGADGLSDSATYAGGEEPAIQAFWRTLVVDCSAYPMKRLDPGYIANHHDDWVSVLRCSVWPNNFASFDAPSDKDEHEEEKRAARKRFSKLNAYQMWERNRNGWTFCVAENGLYAMVRRNARAGDVITVLDGGKVPVILREVPGPDGQAASYVIVGAAYVHGFMDGEAVAKCEQGLLVEREFLIT
ncbi:heterokaryon incompatibility protein-domain-containing protein [Podospora appendiculata]|uniref:Heterokaryon incompatibility protein-domain-containing protein n=1 Tax=Podospora appendiculata TaxID=314037 RepID=A0AAE0XJP5_9PEZI|nr:heterokaryon incompatibility protein-domain-containing protein [Podospora appendiculata]